MVSKKKIDTIWFNFKDYDIDVIEKKLMKAKAEKVSDIRNVLTVNELVVFVLYTNHRSEADELLAGDELIISKFLCLLNRRSVKNAQNLLKLTEKIILEISDFS